MKNNRRTKRNNRRSNRRRQNGGVAFPASSPNYYKSIGINLFVKGVSPNTTLDKQPNQSYLKAINNTTPNGKNIYGFLIKDLDGLNKKCDEEDLKTYVNNIQKVIDVYPDDLVEPEAKEILKEHLSKIGCPADINAEIDRLHGKISFGGRKTRRQK